MPTCSTRPTPIRMRTPAEASHEWHLLGVEEAEGVFGLEVAEDADDEQIGAYARRWGILGVTV